ncbi:hypothetical protein GGTG_10087 [Gaeumannomyces tritici R3-111a-1]|uniref:Uncharacterized protein n=1 Tax=Gaeumannomyces tritici (strain R3-111a-1) TaxID=644352 RepID=J3P9A4_GAET3|nr:hypothetical protein GGTG_10087 [Gaeumannomyces tritici R3-111a-1]EJT73240.1 hypothetical protein GGTG_10087 [Gaeumannomyces tritici R3-111a-1]
MKAVWQSTGELQDGNEAVSALWKLLQAVESCVWLARGQLRGPTRAQHRTLNSFMDERVHHCAATRASCNIHLGGATLATAAASHKAPLARWWRGPPTDGLHGAQQASALNLRPGRGGIGLEPSNQERRLRDPCPVPHNAVADQSALEERDGASGGQAE